MKVLVIDDDSMMIKMIELFFRKAGCETVTAPSAEEGSELIEPEQPDLILVDNEMPGENGIDMCERLRAEGYDKTLCVMSGTISDELLERADNCSVHCMRKPPLYNMILKLIDLTENGG